MYQKHKMTPLFSFKIFKLVQAAKGDLGIPHIHHYIPPSCPKHATLLFVLHFLSQTSNVVASTTNQPFFFNKTAHTC